MYVSSCFSIIDSNGNIYIVDQLVAIYAGQVSSSILRYPVVAIKGGLVYSFHCVSNCVKSI